MAKPLNAEKIIDSVKRRAQIPEHQVTIKTEDFLEFANEEMMVGLVPLILSYNEDYLLYEEQVPVQRGKSNYQIPHRSVGNKLRDIAFRDVNGQLYEMSRIPVENIAEYPTQSSATNVYLYYIKNNEVILVPKNDGTSSGHLVFFYYLSPSDLVLEKDIAIIKSIDRTTGELQLDKVPKDWSLNDLYDMVQVKAPFRPMTIDRPIQSINAVTKTVIFDPNYIPEGLTVGDHLTHAGESNIPQVPIELQTQLAVRIAARCVEAFGDAQGLQMANAKLAEMEQKTASLINNRVEGSPKKVLNKGNFIRQSSARRFRNRW